MKEPTATSFFEGARPASWPQSAKEGLSRLPRIGISPRFTPQCSRVMLGEGFMTGVSAAGGFPIVLPLDAGDDAIDEIFALCDGFLFAGGHDVDPASYNTERAPETFATFTERDAFELKLLDRIVREDRPYLGVCRGHQILNVAAGGTLVQDIETALGLPARLHYMDEPYDREAHSVTVQPNTQLARIVGEGDFPVNSIHHQCVAKLGEGLIASAHSETGIIEAVEMPDKRFVMGVQWHPEYLWRSQPEMFALFQALVDAAAEGAVLVA